MPLSRTSLRSWRPLCRFCNSYLFGKGDNRFKNCPYKYFRSVPFYASKSLRNPANAQGKHNVINTNKEATNNKGTGVPSACSGVTLSGNRMLNSMNKLPRAPERCKMGIPSFATSSTCPARSRRQTHRKTHIIFASNHTQKQTSTARSSTTDSGPHLALSPASAAR